MKQIDLNIHLDEPVYKNKERSEEEIKNKVPITKIVMKPYDVALRWIQIMLENGINDTDPATNTARNSVKLEVHRKYNRVMDTLENHKEGIAVLEDADYKFLYDNFQKAKLPVQRGITKVLDRIWDVIELTQVIGGN